jgi:hypothetical protein
LLLSNAQFARDFVSRTAFRNARASTKEQGTLGKIFRRFFTTKEEDKAVKVAKNATQGSSASRLQKNKNVALYAAAGAIAAIGLSYGAVPLYRLFCESTGYGGTTKVCSFFFSPQSELFGFARLVPCCY